MKRKQFVLEIVVVIVIELNRIFFFVIFTFQFHQYRQISHLQNL